MKSRERKILLHTHTHTNRYSRRLINSKYLTDGGYAVGEEERCRTSSLMWIQIYKAYTRPTTQSYWLL